MPSSSLSGFRDALETCRTLKPDISSITIQTLLEVAMYEDANGSEPGFMGISMADLAKRVNITSPSVSRNVAMFAKHDYTKGRKDGFELVEIVMDPLDRRARYVRLTPKGRMFIQGLRRALGAG